MQRALLTPRIALPCMDAELTFNHKTEMNAKERETSFHISNEKKSSKAIYRTLVGDWDKVGDIKKYEQQKINHG